MTEVETLLESHDQTRYQRGFADLIREHKPDIVVETGVNVGTSTLFILKALDDNGKGKLYSVDPTPCISIEHPRWELVKKLSIDALPEIYRKTGPWDVFLHDSDHSVGCMTLEFEMAWDFVKPGGIIASDDYTWHDHHAWPNFIRRKSATTPIDILGGCQYTIRNGAYKENLNPEETLKSAILLANEACTKFGVQPYYPRCHDDPKYLLNVG